MFPASSVIQMLHYYTLKLILRDSSNIHRYLYIRVTQNMLHKRKIGLFGEENKQSDL